MSYQTVVIIFWGIQDFLIDMVKYFPSLLNSSNLISEQPLARAM